MAIKTLEDQLEAAIRMLSICIYVLRAASDVVTLEKSWKKRFTEVEHPLYLLKWEMEEDLLAKEEHLIKHGRKMVDV
jgi:hypothetical protein